MYNSKVKVQAVIEVNCPESRPAYHNHHNRPTMLRRISLEGIYGVSETEAREVAKSWREANPHVRVRATYTVEV